MRKATIANIAVFLNKTLRTKKIRDSSVNGLQVSSRRNGEVRTVGFGVDACLSTFEKARELGVELLVVHHGIRWKPQKDRVLARSRAEYLKKNRMGLYAAHLPLDLHEIYGNNMQLCRLLDVQDPRKFGRYHGIKIGYAGTFKRPSNLNSIAAILDKALETDCTVHRFGPKGISSIGIISGGGGSMLQEAVAEKLDSFLVGELDLAVYNAAREYGMNLIVGGHYATETVGVRALMPLIREEFGVATVFVHDPKNI